MDEIINKKGIFWIKDESNSFEGKITIRDGYFYLECDNEIFEKLYFKHFESIKGVIESIPVTLLNCNLFSRYNSFMFEYLFKNYNSSEFIFDNTYIKFKYLDSWIQSPLLTTENKKHLIENCVGSNIFSNLNDLDIFLLAEKNLYDLYEFRFNLKYKKPTYFENIFNDAIKINNFLSILMHKKSDIISMSFLVSEDEGKFFTVNVFYKFFSHEDAKLDPNNILINYFEIAEDFFNILATWFEIFEKFKSFFYLYFVNMDSNFTAELLFISYTQAIESYIRKSNYDNFYMDKDEYEWIYKDLEAFINRNQYLSKSHKDSLKSRVKYGNEHSLRKRLKDLVESLDEFLLIDYLNDKYEQNFVNIVIENRNYYTHYDKKDDLVKSGIKLVLLTLDLRLLLELCILNEIGISKELIDKKLKRYFRKI